MTNPKRLFVERIARENRAFYGTPDGKATLRAFELTFERRWIYLFELVQNAIDAGATSIAIDLDSDGDGLVFQHNGTAPLAEADVESLSKLFRSTKGASTVGFMGIGFKSVFGRFRRAAVSGWGWTFRYEVSQMVGETYGDVQPDMLGTVLPIWNRDISPPSRGFSTRFHLSGLADPAISLQSDLSEFLPDADRTPLPILAYSRVERLAIDGHVWELGVHHSEETGTVEATALSPDENILWHLFPVRFAPSPRAIARFLEHRRIQPSESERPEVYEEAARTREVLGVLPLDDYGTPAPPRRGRVYATLPTEVTLPFGLHIHADWLLNISRTGLWELDDNAWQREIVDRIADVLTSFLTWVAATSQGRQAAGAAYTAIGVPVADRANRLENLLANPQWLGRLGTQLRDRAVLPVWTEDGKPLQFAAADDVVVPPQPLADAMDREPRMLPGLLMGGPVLVRSVLGAQPMKLFSLLDLTSEIAPEELQARWEGGLEPWWRELPDDEAVRRDILFHLWGSVAELAVRSDPTYLELPCMRAQDGGWLTVHEARYFKEQLPSDREPGGRQVRDLIESFLPDGDQRLPDPWIGRLRQAAAAETDLGPLTRAKNWVERYATSVDMRDAIDRAVSAMFESSKPDWLVLVDLGHWAMARGTRADLVTHVLANTPSGPAGIPVDEALIADPYVERGEGRRTLFPWLPPISAAYVEGDPRGNDAHGWCSLFEKAGAQGTLRVRSIEEHAGQAQRGKVASFLGIDVSDVRDANRQGYTLQDFDLEPSLPETDAPVEVRQWLAPWLELGFTALRDKGSRRATSYYYDSKETPGQLASLWRSRLTELEWVPDTTGRLRRPRDVLPAPDPAREDSPVADLSDELLNTLTREGLIFGTAIPEAPALRRLLRTGDSLGSGALAELLREIRMQGPADEDTAVFMEAVRKLLIPTPGGERVPTSRIVQRVGGRRRGALGGWILPLSGIAEDLREELTHPRFPYEFPETTSGHQALDYLQKVWDRARVGADPLANEVRDVLPAAYSYCLEDLEDDEVLAKRWSEARSSAAVFADRQWVALGETDEEIYFDDITDRRLFPDGISLRVATSGHFGNSPEQQAATAKALGLSFLSSAVSIEWEERGDLGCGPWADSFRVVYKLLSEAQGPESLSDEAASEARDLRLRCVEELRLVVEVEHDPAKDIPVNARVRDGTLVVSGPPLRFASDAAKELLRDFPIRRRGDLAADLTGLLSAMSDSTEFAVGVAKFARTFAPGFEWPEELGPSPTNGGTLPDNEGAEAPGNGGFPAPTGEVDGEEPSTEEDESVPTRGSYPRKRALAQQQALARKLEAALKGELRVEDDEEPESPVRPDKTEGEGLGDEVYREAAMRFERLCGREPEAGDPRQMGWDLVSVDPESGERRLIEVKGKGSRWTNDEVVELSRPQAHRAFQASESDADGRWFLYVVERTEGDQFEVLPIPNPIQRAGKWMLSGRGWRVLAEGPRTISVDGD